MFQHQINKLIKRWKDLKFENNGDEWIKKSNKWIKSQIEQMKWKMNEQIKFEN